MNGNQLQLLTWIVDRYDTDGEPVMPAEAVPHFDRDCEELDDAFDSLESNCLLAPVDGGYRPTITARELLELDIDDETLIILDTGPERDSGCGNNSQ